MDPVHANRQKQRLLRAMRSGHLLAALLGAFVVLVAPPLFGPDDIQPPGRSAQAGCPDLSLRTSSRAVRPSGRINVQGQVCESGRPEAGATVSLKLRARKRTIRLGHSHSLADGRYSGCSRVPLAKGARLVRLTAVDEHGGTASRTLRVSKKGQARCLSAEGPKPAAGGPDGYTPPPPDSQTYADPDCPISHPGSEIGMTVPDACTVIASDTASDPDPRPFWGKIDCASASRVEALSGGSDSHPTATGPAQPDGSFRRIHVLDGDDVWGERCELGYNWHSSEDAGYGIQGPGPTVLYHEGQRRVTYISIRLPNSWDVSDPDWRTVYQNKQAQPYDNPTMASKLEMQVRSGSWSIISDWSDPLWSAPARTGVWTRFAFDVTYSKDPSLGSLKVYADLNGDGDADDSGEQSPRIHRATLLTETQGPNGDVGAGNAIPSHLRAGVYENENYSCPPPGGCYADFDNVQVVHP